MWPFTSITTTLRQTLRDLSFKNNESEKLAFYQARELMTGDLTNKLVGAAAKGDTSFYYVVPDPKVDKYTKQELSRQIFELLFSPENYLTVHMDDEYNLNINWDD